MSITKWKDKKTVHLHNGILLSYKKKKDILLFRDGMYGSENIKVSEIPQSEKERWFHSVTQVNEQNELRRKIEID